jgi:AhpD family alkylhydroperoxidase
MLQHSRDGYLGLAAAERYVANCGLEPNLLHLVKLRVSQINGCAYCIDMHWKDLRALGEGEQRLYGLNAWEESPYYSERERAALAYAEAVTRISEGHASDAVYDKARGQFNEKEISDLTLAITTINAWNRIAISSRTPAGSYKVGEHKQ